MNALLIPLLSSAVRHGATLLAGALLSRGLLDSDSSQLLIAAIVAIGAFGLSVGSKLMARNKLLASITGDINEAVAAAPADALRGELRAAAKA